MRREFLVRDILRMRTPFIGGNPRSGGADGAQPFFPEGVVFRVDEVGKGELVAVDDGSGVGHVEEFEVADGGVAEELFRVGDQAVDVVAFGGRGRVAGGEEGVGEEAVWVEVGGAREHHSAPRCSLSVSAVMDLEVWSAGGGELPVMAYSVDLGLFASNCIDYFHDAICDGPDPVVGHVERSVCESVAKRVRSNNPITFVLEVLHLIAPVVCRGGEPMDKGDIW